MLELLPPPLEPGEPPPDDDEEEEPEEPPELGMPDGMLLLEDWPAQPPIRNAEIEPINVACIAMASSRFIEWPAFIALSLMRSPAMAAANRHDRRCAPVDCATVELNVR